tara:strand:+ start:655 stop:858 length:204 start_codon:yes stop_codon:yes gene_type:complete
MANTILATMEEPHIKLDTKAKFNKIRDAINANNIHGTCSNAEFAEKVKLAKSKVHRASYFEGVDYEG